TAYEISRDWSSDVCSSDLCLPRRPCPGALSIADRAPLARQAGRASHPRAEAGGQLGEHPVQDVTQFGFRMDEPVLVGGDADAERSEERRVGREGGSGGAAE